MKLATAEWPLRAASRAAEMASSNCPWTRAKNTRRVSYGFYVQIRDVMERLNSARILTAETSRQRRIQYHRKQTRTSFWFAFSRRHKTEPIRFENGSHLRALAPFQLPRGHD